MKNEKIVAGFWNLWERNLSNTTTGRFSPYNTVSLVGKMLKMQKKGREALNKGSRMHM